MTLTDRTSDDVQVISNHLNKSSIVLTLCVPCSCPYWNWDSVSSLPFSL